MKKNLSALFAIIAWFAVITQYILMIENRVVSIPESTLRFFSYFTILTNSLVAIYFTYLFLSKDISLKNKEKPGMLTAITIYITMVGLVYQIALRHVWEPQGLQRIVDELLHSVIPVLVIIFWYLYEFTQPIKYKQIFNWAIYPSVYLLFILIAGNFSGYYPYPFIDVTKIGMASALISATVLVLLFMGISFLFVFIGKKLIKR